MKIPEIQVLSASMINGKEGIFHEILKNLNCVVTDGKVDCLINIVKICGHEESERCSAQE